MNVSKNFATYRLVLKAAMEEADKHAWIQDKIVIPFTSIVLQDVYYIKTHSKDNTTAGGINLKVRFFVVLFLKNSFLFYHRNIIQWQNLFQKTLCNVNRVKYVII
jgi:hypothetical protein